MLLSRFHPVHCGSTANPSTPTAPGLLEIPGFQVVDQWMGRVEGIPGLYSYPLPDQTNGTGRGSICYCLHFLTFTP